MALKYINLSQLMASVEADLHSFADNDMIDRGKVIKVVRRVNEDIGLKINKERDAVVEITEYKGLLPVDFLFLQLAMVCHKYKYHQPGEIYGTRTEEIECVKNVEVECPTDTNSSAEYKVIQTFKDKIVTLSDFQPIAVHASKSMFAPNCPNARINCANAIRITDDGEVIAGFEEGKIYINYLSDMMDEEGNLLILDHPLLRDYYEYAVKKHLIEIMMVNSDANVSETWKMYKAELYEARLRALNFINTIEYSQIQGTYVENRARFFNKHMRMFE